MSLRSGMALAKRRLARVCPSGHFQGHLIAHFVGHFVENSMGRARASLPTFFAALALQLMPASSSWAGSSAPATSDSSSLAAASGESREGFSAPSGAPVATPAASSKEDDPRERPFTWKASCLGWSGLRLEFTRKTLLGQLVPEVTNAPQLNLAWRQSTNGLKVRLDQ